MRTIRFKGINTFVMFRHDDAVRLGKKGLEYVEVTTCAIFTAEGVRQIASGLSVKSENDESNDLVGVEKALGRALQKLTDDKAERAAYWDAFRASIEAEDYKRFEEELNANLPPFYEQGLQGPQPFGEGDFDPEPLTGVVRAATQTVGGYGVAAPGTPSYSSDTPDDPYGVDFSRGLLRQFEPADPNAISNVLPFVKPANPRIEELEKELKSLESDHGADGYASGPTEGCSICNRVREQLAAERAAA